VPSRLIREQLEAHDRDPEQRRPCGEPCPFSHTTIPEHMPSAHRRYAEWTPARMKREAAKIGPATIALMEAIMKAKPHPEQGFRACLGILRLAPRRAPPALKGGGACCLSH
jgi:transposase